MEDSEEVKRLKAINEDLKKSLIDALAGATNMDNLVEEFKKSSAPGVDAIHKTIEQLKKVQTQLEPLFRNLSKLKPEELAKLMKP